MGMNLTAKYMKEPWAQGLVMGFVSKQEVKRILIDNSTVSGTFLLRFSDSELGGVTIAYVKQESLHLERSVEMVVPFTSTDLARRPIAESVMDIGQELTFLYQSPEQGGPREKKVFRKFQRNNSTVQPGSGYVPFDLRYELTQQPANTSQVQPQVQPQVNLTSRSNIYEPVTLPLPRAEDDDIIRGHILDNILELVPSQMEVQM